MRVGQLHISRFKSIRSLDLACRKVNVFIGPPDTGKTNILDALTFLSRVIASARPSILTCKTS